MRKTCGKRLNIPKKAKIKENETVYGWHMYERKRVIASCLLHISMKCHVHRTITDRSVLIRQLNQNQKMFLLNTLKCCKATDIMRVTFRTLTNLKNTRRQ